MSTYCEIANAPDATAAAFEQTASAVSFVPDCKSTLTQLQVLGVLPLLIPSLFFFAFQVYFYLQAGKVALKSPCSDYSSGFSCCCCCRRCDLVVKALMQLGDVNACECAGGAGGVLVASQVRTASGTPSCRLPTQLGFARSTGELLTLKLFPAAQPGTRQPEGANQARDSWTREKLEMKITLKKGV